MNEYVEMLLALKWHVAFGASLLAGAFYAERVAQ